MRQLVGVLFARRVRPSPAKPVHLGGEARLDPIWSDGGNGPGAARSMPSRSSCSLIGCRLSLGSDVTEAEHVYVPAEGRHGRQVVCIRTSLILVVERVKQPESSTV